MSVTAYIRELLAKGLGMEQALLAAEVYEANPPKSKAAVRQQRYRNNRNAASRVTPTVTEVLPDKEIPHTPLEINPPPSPPKGGSSPTQRRFANPMVVLQGQVDAMTAQRWVTHCDEKGRKPSSVQAEELCQVLAAVKARGANAVDALKFAMGKGWTSLSIEYLENNGFKFPAAAPKSATIDWPTVIHAFRTENIWYEKQYGPRPGEAGCRAPPELLIDAA